MKTIFFLAILFCCFNNLYAQISLTGDGFGGRSWYVAHNYQVGAYTGFTVCGPAKQLYAWGGNVHGELGIGNTVSTTVPVAVPGMTDVKFYTTGYLSGAIKNDNTAWCWGNLPPQIIPTPTQWLSNVKFIDGGISHIVFVKNDGTVWGAGKNYHGELGNGTTVPSNTTLPPVQMIGVNNAVRAVAIGEAPYSTATLILLADSTVKITGGDGWFTTTVNTVPVTMPGLTQILDIKGSALAAYALNANGEVYSFGTETSWGALGLSVPTFTFMPATKITFPAGAAPIIALSANNDGFSALALDENGNVYAWGYNDDGELGDGTNISRNKPVLVATNSIDIYAGETFSYILKADNTLWATGTSGWNSNYGSIWMNQTNVTRNVFTQIDPISAPMNLCAPIPWVVPVKLLNFTCSKTGSSANLMWSSAEETNLDKYVVEYSQDGLKFQQIGFLKAKGAGNNYYYTHRPFNGIAYYRLRIINNDGSFINSFIRSLQFYFSNSLVISPNPAKDVIYISKKNEDVINVIQIISANGNILKVLYNQNCGQPINISELPGGSYLVKTIINNSSAEYARFIK